MLVYADTIGSGLEVKADPSVYLKGLLGVCLCYKKLETNVHSYKYLAK